MSTRAGMHSPPDVPLPEQGATQVVWKYGLADHALAQDLDVPEGARLVHAEVQHGTPAFWLQCDPTAKHRLVRFMIVPTGKQVPAEWHYVCTWVLAHGALVLHAFADAEVRRG